MFTRRAILDLIAHMEWADGEVWHAVLACVAAGDDAPMRRRLRHLHVVQRAFLSVWQGAPPIFPADGEFAGLPDLRDWSRPVYADTRTVLATVSDEQLARPVSMPWAAELARQLGREPGTPTLAETMFQVTSHSTYHRGQINARLRELGGEPPLVDYIAWIWFGRPPAR